MLLASVGELLLISALLWTVSRLLPYWRVATVNVSAAQGWSVPVPSQRGYVMLLCAALLMVALTASVGAIRFALSDTSGSIDVIWQPLVELHDRLSWLSRQLAMPLYVLCALWLWGRVGAKVLLLLAVVSQLPLLGAPALLTDAVLLLALLRLAQSAQPRWVFIGAIVSLLLVPLCGVLIADKDIAMGVFHLCLALHFVGFSCALPRPRQQQPS